MNAKEIIDQTKRCTACRRELDLIYFHNSNLSYDGKFYVCKDCQAYRNKKSYLKKKLKIKQLKSIPGLHKSIYDQNFTLLNQFLESDPNNKTYTLKLIPVDHDDNGTMSITIEPYKIGNGNFIKKIEIKTQLIHKIFPMHVEKLKDISYFLTKNNYQIDNNTIKDL